MSLFGFGPAAEIRLDFADSATRTRKAVGAVGQKDSKQLLIFHGEEAVSGTVDVVLPPGKRLEHQGIKVEMIGQIEMFYDRGNSYDFTSIVRELEAAGVMEGGSRNYTFDFSTVDKPYESYSGINVRLRYFVRVTITRSYGSNIIKEEEFLVQTPSTEETAMTNTLKMEVGIEDCLHIEFEYDKNRYHLADVILGKVFFLLVRIKIKHMEVAIIRREACGTGSNQYNETETLTKFEIMDGAPVKGECIPVRLFLSQYNLTPTYRNVNNRFSVRYYLNLVLVDEEDRRYFKQQEVIFWRQELG